MVSSDSQIDKLQRWCPKRAELLDVNINTGTQSINTDRVSLRDSQPNRALDAGHLMLDTEHKIECTCGQHRIVYAS